MKKINRYIKIWWMMSKNSFSVVLGERLALSFFLVGKILRFIFFFGFLYFLLLGSGNLAGYSSNQIIFFYLTFNVIDVITQFFFREVYSFRGMIINGDFDLVLVKPISALFRVLLGGADIIDLITIPPLVILVVHYGFLLHPTMLHIVYYILLLLNGFIIATAFHVIILSLAIITLEVDHTVMIYRDMVSLGRFPIDIYKEPLKAFLTYIIPVGLMVTLPSKALIGFVSPIGVLLALVFGLFIIFLSLKFWRYATTKYTSASS